MEAATEAAAHEAAAVIPGSQQDRIVGRFVSGLFCKEAPAPKTVAAMPGQQAPAPEPVVAVGQQAEVLF